MYGSNVENDTDTLSDTHVGVLVFFMCFWCGWEDPPRG